jgi:hypothetical protein
MADEALERAVAEIEALQAIYEADFVVHSVSELAAATETGEAVTASLHVSLHLPEVKLQLKCSLPPGYPITAPARVSIEGRTRKEEDFLTDKMQAKATELLGQEAIMELVHELQELANEMDVAAIPEESAANETESSFPENLGRRWIWAHHITDTARRKSIVQEARELKLGGYLKAGYPGIVVVEGFACDEFVNWIKGSKSRPGGFGRNWGHHCKGELNDIATRQLPLDFTELQDMRELGNVCKEHGLEEEFLEYVMQHK